MPCKSGDMPANQSTCQSFVSSFGEDPQLGMKLLQTTQNGVTIDFSLYTAYRPVVWPDGKVPVITWGNGTCAQPEGYGALLRYVASFGYFVVAANSRWTTSGTPAPMINAINYAAAANMDSTSPYYQKLDMTKVGAMGHSQGGSATASAASDSRVKDVIIFNFGDSGVAKPYLAISGRPGHHRSSPPRAWRPPSRAQRSQPPISTITTQPGWGRRRGTLSSC